MPSRIKRFHSNPDNVKRYLPDCNKIISATGFKARTIRTNSGINLNSYHKQTGIIAHNLFGLGIAYPEEKLTPTGDTELQVALWKFMNYLNRVLPIWKRY